MAMLVYQNVVTNDADTSAPQDPSNPEQLRCGVSWGRSLSMPVRPPYRHNWGQLGRALVDNEWIVRYSPKTALKSNCSHTFITENNKNVTHSGSNTKTSKTCCLTQALLALTFKGYLAIHKRNKLLNGGLYTVLQGAVESLAEESLYGCLLLPTSIDKVSWTHAT